MKTFAFLLFFGLFLSVVGLALGLSLLANGEVVSGLAMLAAVAALASLGGWITADMFKHSAYVG